MKKIIEKIKRIMNDHPRIFVVLLLLILLIVIFIIYRIADKYLNYSTVEKTEMYTYVGTQKLEFDADMTISRKGLISDIKPEININFDSAPIYTNDKIIFTNDEIIIFPQENYLEYRLQPFTYISDGKLITKDFDENIEHYFIYDGLDTYFFSDEGEIIVGESKIKLSKYSYLICSSNRIDYYDTTTNNIGSIEISNTAEYKTDYYTVNISEDTVGESGNILPNSVKYIKFISEYSNLQKKD